MLAVVSNVFGNALMFVTVLIMTRTMTIADYGEFRLLFTFYSFCVVVLMLGRDSMILRLFNQNKESGEILKETVYGLVTVLVGFVLLLVSSNQIVYFLFSNGVEKHNFITGLMMIPLWAAYNMLTPLMRINGKNNTVFVMNNFIQRFLRLPVFVFLFWAFSPTVQTANIAMIFSQIILLLIVIKMTKNYFSFEKAFSYESKFLDNFIASFSLCFNTIVFTFFTTLAVLVLGKYSSTSDVAMMDLNVLLCTLMLFPFVALSKSTEPYFSEITSKYREKYIKNRGASFILLIMASGCLIIFSQEILSIFGAEYVKGADALTALVLLYSVSSIFGASPEWLNMTGHARVTSYALIISLSISLFYYIFLQDLSLASVSFGLGVSLCLYRLSTFLGCCYLNREVASILRFSSQQVFLLATLLLVAYSSTQLSFFTRVALFSIVSGYAFYYGFKIKLYSINLKGS